MAGMEIATGGESTAPVVGVATEARRGAVTTARAACPPLASLVVVAGALVGGGGFPVPRDEMVMAAAVRPLRKMAVPTSNASHGNEGSRFRRLTSNWPALDAFIGSMACPSREDDRRCQHRLAL